MKAISVHREQERRAEERREKQRKIAAKKQAEKDRLAAKKKANEEKIAQEKLNAVLAKWEAAARAEMATWKARKVKLTIYSEDKNVFFVYSFLNEGNLTRGTDLYGEVFVEFNNPSLTKFHSGRNIVGDKKIETSIGMSECLTSLRSPETTKEIKSKFLNTFGVGEFNRVYPPKRSYKAYFMVTGMSASFGEVFDFHQEFYPELKQKYSFEQTYKFITPIIFDLE